MYNKQMLKAMLHERLSETAEEIFQLFEQAAAEFQREIDRLREMGQAKKPMEAFSSLSLLEAQQSLTVGQGELSVLSEGNATPFPCIVKTEHWMATPEDEPQMLITNIKSTDSGDERQPEPLEQQAEVKTERPEVRGGAETNDSSEAEEEISDTIDYEEGKFFRCPICKKRFPQKRGVVLHMRRVHTDDAPLTSAELAQPGPKSARAKTFSCTVCDKRFLKFYSLKIHLKEHAGDDLFKCTECKVTFSKEAYFIRHMNTVHSIERPFKCSVCTKHSKTTGALRAHMQIHTGERPCKCSICGKAFVQSATLARHMMTHTGEKPFCCAKCGKRYGSKQNLKIHKKITNH